MTQQTKFGQAAHRRAVEYREAHGFPAGERPHRLRSEDAEHGANFVQQVALDAARERSGSNRDRAMRNLLSSQAMCFNIFAPLRCEEGRVLAAKALRRFLPDLATVERIEVEYLPEFDIFRDQQGLTGVASDLLIEYRLKDGGQGLLCIETKFIEPAFSDCSYRRIPEPDPDDDRPSIRCPESRLLGAARYGCPYQGYRGWLYWKRTDSLGTLKPEATEGGRCPFGGPLWQLWVNHTLVHELKRRWGADRAIFAVLAPRANELLLGKDLEHVEAFRALLQDPTSFAYIPLEELLAEFGEHLPEEAGWKAWHEALVSRYLVPVA